jgi:transcription antitermination factor NusG
MVKNLASKRDLIRIANKKQTVVTYKKPIVASLMFIHCTESFLKALKHNHLSVFSYYTRFSNQDKTNDKKVPAVIPDDQMQAFIWLTSTDHKVSYLGEPKDIKLGDRVRVTEGPFKGFIGNIKRIKKDRKFVITIGTIAAFTIEGITHKMVEKIE